MSDTTADATAATQDATTGAAATASVVPPGATVAGQQAADAEPDRVSKLPEWAQKELTAAREDAAKARTDAKAQAAEDAKAELAQTIGKALGLVEDGKPVDPAELTAKIAEAEAAKREANLELAVYKASTSKADPTKLLDSRSFLAAIKDIDPADTAKITKAIDDAVTANPSFKSTAQAVGKSGADFAGGPSGPTDLQTRIAAAEKAGNVRESIALKQQLAQG